MWDDFDIDFIIDSVANVVVNKLVDIIFFEKVDVGIITAVLGIFEIIDLILVIKLEGIVDIFLWDWIIVVLISGIVVIVNELRIKRKAKKLEGE